VACHYQRRRAVAARATPDSDVSSGADAPPPVSLPSPPAGAPSSSSSTPNGNTGLAGGAVAAGVALFLAVRLLTGGPSIAALEQEAVPLDVALRNGKPTVVEFYASWCVCLCAYVVFVSSQA
jgi:hypothetical protein